MLHFIKLPNFIGNTFYSSSFNFEIIHGKLIKKCLYYEEINKIYIYTNMYYTYMMML